jgi:hypothetical protein
MSRYFVLDFRLPGNDVEREVRKLSDKIAFVFGIIAQPN